MSGDDSSLSLRAPARETVFRPFPLASPSGVLYIERMFFLRRCINQSVHYLRLYRSLYSNTTACIQCSHPDTSLPRVFLSRQWPSHICRTEEVRYRLAAPLVGKEVRDRGPVFPPLAFLQHPYPQYLLLALPLRTHLEEVVPRFLLAPGPSALWVWPALRPVEILSGKTVRRLDLVCEASLWEFPALASGFSASSIYSWKSGHPSNSVLQRNFSPSSPS